MWTSTTWRGQGPPDAVSRKAAGDSPANSLANHVVLVTGAGDGIGKTLALTAAAHGATVILSGRTASKLESVYDNIVEAGGPEPGIAPMDLGGMTQGDLDKLAEALDRNYGRLDGLVHNAAILGERLPFEQYPADAWRKVMQVNLDAVVDMTRALLPLLRKSDKGRLIFTSSGVGARPRAYWGAYAVSKYAVEGFAKLLADELENTSAVRVNIVNPGATRTAMRAAAYPAEDPGTVKTPQALMPLYLYLLGEDSHGEHGRLFTQDWLDGAGQER